MWSRISKMADRMAAISAICATSPGARRRMSGRSKCAMIDDALALMEPRFKTAGADVSYDRRDTPVWVMGGQLRLQQVIVNLLNNALDAMDGPTQAIAGLPSRPTPATRTMFDPCARPGTRPGGGRAGAAVRPVLHHQEPGQGLGLGLSISYNIVRDFDGTLSARNREMAARNSPSSCVRPKPRCTSAVWRPNEPEETVLFVDDEEHLRDAVEQSLQLADLDVTCLSDAEAALANVSRTFPGILVTDIRMEGMDGLTLMRRCLDIDPAFPVDPGHRPWRC
jgi:signal transduction histidine kinase